MWYITLLVDLNPICIHTKPSLGKQFLSARLNQFKYCGNQITTVRDFLSNKTKTQSI